MKNITLIILFILSLAACETYTVKNNLDKDIRAGSVLIQKDNCAEFINFFYIFGDFPIRITDNEGEDLEKDKEYQAANYEILKSNDLNGRDPNAFVKETDTPCKNKK